MKTKKASSYKKLALTMLLSAAGGGALGIFVMLVMNGKMDSIEGGMVYFLRLIQRFQLQLLLGITVLSVIFEEWNFRKLREIVRKIQEESDEECDRWEYEEERIGAQGTIVNVLSQILCILVLSVGYSIRYIEENHAGNMLAACLVFLVCYVYDGFWQVRFVKQVQKAHPEKVGDPASRKFHQQWMESCDEAEREVIYQSAYKAYIKMNTWIPALLVVSMLGHLLFNTGIMAIMMVAVIWLVLSFTYLHSCVGLKGMKIRE